MEKLVSFNILPASLVSFLFDDGEFCSGGSFFCTPIKATECALWAENAPTKEDAFLMVDSFREAL